VADRCCSAEGTCWFMQLYTQEFYQTVVKRKLAPGGVFVTQSGPAGVLSATQVYPFGKTG
jgi:thermospermine synthase